MNNLSIVITAGVVLAVITGGYYGFSMLPADEGASQTPGDENIPDTDQNSKQNNILSENREIKGRDDKDSESEESQSKMESWNGITITSDVIAGENARMVIYEKGKRLTEQTAYLDGEKIGETSETGALIFEVPNREEIEISTDSGLQSSFEVETHNSAKLLRTNFISLQNNSDIQDYIADISLELYVEKDAKIQIYLDDKTIDRKNLSGEERYGYSKEKLLSQGEHSLSVSAQFEDSVESQTVTFSTLEEKPIAEIGLNTPESGYDLTSYEDSVDLGYRIRPIGRINATLMLNNTVLESKIVEPSDSYQYFDHEIDYSSYASGKYNWYIKAVNDNNTGFSEKRVINIE